MVGDGSPDLRSELVGGCLAAMLKDKVNTRLAGMLSITSESGGRLSIDISRRIVSGNFVIRVERQRQAVSLYVSLSKRTLLGQFNQSGVSVFVRVPQAEQKDRRQTVLAAADSRSSSGADFSECWGHSK